MCGIKYDMDERHKRKLTVNAVVLTKDLDLSPEFLASLHSDQILSDNQRELLSMNTKTSQAKNSDFQRIIRKTGPRAFKCLIKALVHTQQTHIAYKLDADLAKEFEEIAQESANAQPTSPIRPAFSTPKFPTEDGPVQSKGRMQRPHSAGALGSLPTQEDLMRDPEMKIWVSKVPDRVKSEYKRKLESDSAYRIKNNPRGKFVIFNNTTFCTKKKRDGTEWDVKNLRWMAEQLHFEIIEYSDHSAEEIITGIHGLSEQDYCNDDAIIICVLSHGNKDIIYGSDDQMVDIQTNILQPFYGKTCPSLSGKPKIFIIQACQGAKRAEGVPQADGEEFVDFTHIEQADGDVDWRVPHDSDVFLALATTRDHVSFRLAAAGSWFIRSIVYVFCSHAHEDDMSSLFTKVKRLVASLQTSGTMRCVQMPETRDTARKQLYFLPGYNPKH